MHAMHESRNYFDFDEVSIQGKVQGMTQNIITVLMSVLVLSLQHHQQQQPQPLK